jgi:hypothetical protein
MKQDSCQFAVLKKKQMNQGELGDRPPNAQPIAVFSFKPRKYLPGFAPSPWSIRTGDDPGKQTIRFPGLRFPAAGGIWSI